MIAALLPAVPAPATLAIDAFPELRGRFVRAYDVSDLMVRVPGGERPFGLLGVRAIITPDGRDRLGSLARWYLDTRLRGKRITLEVDETVPGSDNPLDNSGYAMLDDGTCLNEEVLRLGYARVDESVPFKRLERFRTLERTAKEQGLGVWDTRYAPASWDEETSCSDAILIPGTCGVSPPEVIPATQVDPVYPKQAIKKRREGRLVLVALITREGRVAAASPLRTLDDGFTNAAIAAVAQWRYRPALRDGQPVDVYLPIVMRFVIVGR
jgi:TonB family protein